MREFEREEALWEPETGMENWQDQSPTENLQEAQVDEVPEAEFEIPDIPATFSVPEVPKTEVFASAEKEAEKQMIQEKRCVRGPSRGKLLLTGLLCGLLGAALGAVATWLVLTMT